ncbi:putative peptidyl-tRNA hydrolase PTRHD1 [Echinococcus granulosus]|uniref:peptidyl-tRNA hydrolase n=1 Tax=Echinococcus granulosus TaxID=6210 RepID=A0A068WE60_ECHGR|nr:putative peptidyl-tRNA hydrolase PTRHD1 [Echinococcus granulosus]CDS18353.1 protein tyrosine phosphatase low molecular weight [Echinococcus granulosus]
MTASTLVQYIVVRSDLKASLSWSLGSVIAQACHASTAALQKFAEHEDTRAYVADLENMRKVVLGVSDEAKLAYLSQCLEGEQIDFVLWREQPENILTALALRPYQKKAAHLCTLARIFKNSISHLPTGNILLCPLIDDL